LQKLLEQKFGKDSFNGGRIEGGEAASSSTCSSELDLVEAMVIREDAF